MRKSNSARAGWLLLLAVALVLGATPAFAQTSGVLEGKVTDDTGGPLPGVTVTLTGESLIGNRTITTDVDGSYRFPSIPPGAYKVRASLSGFGDAEKFPITVGIDRTVHQNLQMRLATENVEVVVLGETPVVDQATTETGANITRELFETLPLGRNFTAIVAVAPGTNEDGSGTTVYGSTGAENTYIIDGLNSTGVGYGTEGKNMNLEFIQEVEVKTGGYQAEYGRATGGIVNVVTKQGGNEFTGDVFYYLDNDSFQGTSRFFTGTSITASTFTIGTGYDRKDYGIDLGGYVVKDRLWFFAAFNRVDRVNKSLQVKDAPDAVLPQPEFTALARPVAGEKLDDDITRNLFATKLTWRITDNSTAVVSLNGDPRKISANGRGGGPYAAFRYDSEDGSTDYLGKFDWVGGGSVLLNLLAGQHNEENRILPVLPESSTLPGFQSLTDARFPREGGLGFINDETFSRTVARVDVTKFVSGFLGGDHEIKVGADYELLKADITNTYTGTVGGPDYLLPRFVTQLGSDTFEHRFYSRLGADSNNLLASDFQPNFSVEPETKNTSAYIQDTWKAGSRITLNLGLRWESQKLYDQLGEARISIDDNWAPRLGVIFDPTGSGSSKVYGSAGYFYESIPMDINVRALGGEVSGQSFTGSFANPIPDPSDTSEYVLLFGNGGEPIDEGIKGQYIAEYVLGYDVAISNKFGVGVKGIYRTLERVIEDRFAGFNENGDPIYSIGNPGRGDFTNGLWCEYTGCYSSVDTNDPEQLATLFRPVAEPKRYYKGLEISATKRLSDNWQMIASYVYSKLEGNYDGAFQATTGQLDPNINSAYDYANFLTNGYGYLTGDRRHQFKLNGSYVFPFKLTTGFTFYYQTGTPFNRYGYWNGYSNWEILLDKRGTLRRQPDDYELDLHFSYPFDIGPTVAQIELDVFRALNRQGGVYRDEIWSYSEEDNAQMYARNPDYGKIVAYQAPTAIRLSARVSF